MMKGIFCIDMVVTIKEDNEISKDERAPHASKWLLDPHYFSSSVKSQYNRGGPNVVAIIDSYFDVMFVP